MKLNALQKKCKRQIDNSRRLKCRLSLLQKSIEDQREKITSLPDNYLENISDNQKEVIKAIVNAAKTVDSRGRRYNDEFIMLCMLMNIKSRSYY